MDDEILEEFMCACWVMHIFDGFVRVLCKCVMFVFEMRAVLCVLG